MVTFNMKKLVVTVFAALNLLVTNFVVECVQAAEVKQAGPKRHKLPATLETTQWGWLDPKESPKLTVDSGDIVSIETMMHSHNKIQPGTTMDEIVGLRKANPGGGPHSVTVPSMSKVPSPEMSWRLALKELSLNHLELTLTCQAKSSRRSVLWLRNFPKVSSSTSILIRRIGKPNLNPES